MREWGCEHCARMSTDAPRLCEVGRCSMCDRCTDEHDTAEHPYCPRLGYRVVHGEARVCGCTGEQHGPSCGMRDAGTIRG